MRPPVLLATMPTLPLGSVSHVLIRTVRTALLIKISVLPAPLTPDTTWMALAAPTALPLQSLLPLLASLVLRLDTR